MATERMAFRRAVAMGFDTPTQLRVGWSDQALMATQPIPSDVAGHDPKFHVRGKHDPVTARVRLDRFGRKAREGDRLRESPGGKPLTLMMGSTPSNRDRERDESWKRSMRDIGIRIDFVKLMFPVLLTMLRAGQLISWPVGSITSHAEGDSFAQLLNFRNIGQSNYARFRNNEYDGLYVRSKRLLEGTGRNKLFAWKAEIVSAYAPPGLGVDVCENTLARPRVQGNVTNGFWKPPWKYYDVLPNGGRIAKSPLCASVRANWAR